MADTSQEAFEKWARDNMIGNGTNREAARLAWQASRLATQEEDCRRMCVDCKAGIPAIRRRHDGINGPIWLHDKPIRERSVCAASPIREGMGRNG